MATYYITQSGSGSHDGSSYANSDSVAHHNAGTYAAGDTIYLCGTITSQVIPPSSGSSGNVITYRGDYPSYAGILNGITVSDYTGGFHITSKSYITVDSLTVTGTTSTNHMGIGIRVTAVTADCDGITIRNCDVNSNDGDGLNTGTDDPGSYHLDNIIIEYCDVQSNWGNGLLTGNVETSIIIRYNNFDGNGTCTDPSYCIAGDTSGSYMHNIYVGYSQAGGTHYVYGNRLCNGPCGQGIKIKNNADVYWNFIKDNKDHGIMFVNYAGVTSTQRAWSNVVIQTNSCVAPIYFIGEGNGTNTVYLYNNSIYMTNHRVTWDAGIGFYNEAAANSCDSLTCKNNIIYVPSDSQCYHTGSSEENATPLSSTIENNLCYGPSSIIAQWNGSDRTWAQWQALGFDSPSGYNQDPKYTDASSDDLTLQSSSPCIDTGENLGTTFQLCLDPTTAWTLQAPGIVSSSVVTANQNSCGSGWEIGAFVYGVEKKTLFRR